MVDYTLTPNKSLIKPNRGTYVDVWDTPINNDWDYVDRALGGTFTVATTSGDVNLTVDQARYQQIKLPNSSNPSPRVITFPLIDGSSTTAVGGMWIVDNTASTQGIVVSTAAPGSSSLTIPAGKKQLVFSNGSGIFFADDIRVTAGTGLTLTGSVMSLTSPVTSALGGTGFAGGYTNGQILIGKADGTLNRTTIQAGSNVTITNGDGTITIASTASGGGTTGLTTVSFNSLVGLNFTQATVANPSVTVSGTLGIGNGGTGSTGIAAGIVKSNGSSLGAVSAITLGTETSGTLPVSQGGTGTTTSIGTGANVLNTNPGFSGTATFATISASGNISSSGTVSGAGVSSSGAISASGGVSAGGTVSGNQLLITSSPTSIIGFLNNASAYYINYSTSTGVFGVYMNGGMYSCSTTNFAVQQNLSVPGTIFNPSDARAKTNVQPYSKSIDAITSLNPVTFQYNGMFGTPNDGQVRVGLIAQDVQNSQLPSLVNELEYYDQKTGEKTKYLGVSSTEIIFALVNTVKELDARIKVLEGKVGP